MDHNCANPYDAEFHVAEVYDQCETALEDVEFLRGLIATFGPLKILEPFCGTGRILLPLAVDGTGQFAGLWESTNIVRLATGAIAGAAASVFVYAMMNR